MRQSPRSVTADKHSEGANSARTSGANLKSGGGEWGSGKAAAEALGMMTRSEVGSVISSVQLGNGAQEIGPTLMILIGAHDVTIISNGLGDTRALARRMLDVAEPRIRLAGAQREPFFTANVVSVRILRTDR